ncbi:PRC-barrel domain-containing protein [Microcoleus sp. bin38.metabat.b11b12b14.051]|uniref:YsnF/AvaK domain-containing protein n=1 Tax=Microcoleus sp. bin38.metabat.b11b12b14.051 TaxID=2742709 RepID=UPI0025E17BC7|nr:PRC-barrel domain-containing protein [Microcoleus sp. bin38.metabat.b11b12b14.051]
MNGQASAETIATAKSATRLNRVPEKVRTKLKSFTVKDNQGHLAGKIKDVYFDDNGQLNFVVAGLGREKPRIFLVSIKLLKKVDYHQKSLFLSITPEQVDLLPGVSANAEPHSLENSSEVLSEFSNSHSTNPSTLMLNQTDADRQNDNLHITEHEDGFDVVDREVIRLLEERLVINRSKRKVGEVIVRKEIETRMVQVPIQWEKLIVEQVGDDPKVLAEIDLGEGNITGIDLKEIKSDRQEPTVKAEFTSVQKASKILNSIASQPRHGCVKVRIEIVLENKQLEETYQKWMTEHHGDS